MWDTFLPNLKLFECGTFGFSDGEAANGTLQLQVKPGLLPWIAQKWSTENMNVVRGRCPKAVKGTE